VSDTTPQTVETVPVANQPYQPPAITHDLQLETRAGSPLGGDPLVDPLGIDPAQPN